MKALVTFLVVLLTFACGPAPTAESLPVRASVTDGALTVELLSAEPLHVGQNPVRYRVLHDGQPAGHAMLAQRPLMDMGSMKHACPLQNPDHEPAADGLFPGSWSSPCRRWTRRGGRSRSTSRSSTTRRPSPSRSAS